MVGNKIISHVIKVEVAPGENLCTAVMLTPWVICDVGIFQEAPEIWSCEHRLEMRQERVHLKSICLFGQVIWYCILERMKISVDGLASVFV